jgi:predicted DNA-binding transcriptional regulator AlpA
LEEGKPPALEALAPGRLIRAKEAAAITRPHCKTLYGYGYAGPFPVPASIGSNSKA